MTDITYDSRAIANLMLDEGERVGHRVSNLALQKLSYFAHAIFLIERNRPLVSGYFEAWEYGPVHPTAYQAFKTAGSQPISFRARRLDAATGARMDILPPNDVEITRHAARIMQSYGSMMPGRLVD